MYNVNALLLSSHKHIACILLSNSILNLSGVVFHFQHKGSRFVVWSRKFDPMIDQTVVNSIDRHLLGISYKGISTCSFYMYRFASRKSYTVSRPSSPVRQVRRAPDHFFGQSRYPPYHFCLLGHIDSEWGYRNGLVSVIYLVAVLTND